MTSTLKGACLCGQVRFQATGEVKRVSACYCSQCRKQNGGGAFHAAEMQGELSVEHEGALVWFDSSTKAKRGFCSRCGSSLFWRSRDDPTFFDISLGTLDDVSGLKLTAHIFVDGCPSYLTIPSAAPHLTQADIENNPLAGD